MSPSEMPANCSSDAGPPSRGDHQAEEATPVARTNWADLLPFVVAISTPTVLFSSRACHAVFSQIPLSETIYLQFLVLDRWLGPRKTPWAKFRVTLCSGPPYCTFQCHFLDLPSTLPSSSPQGSTFKHLLQGTRRSQVCPLPLSSAPSPSLSFRHCHASLPVPCFSVQQRRSCKKRPKKNPKEESWGPFLSHLCHLSS